MVLPSLLARGVREAGRIRWLALLAGLGLLGCGRAGTWDDDPKNWGRAFRSTKPPDVVVVHSHYWRSPHWTYEYEYFFHIRTNAFLARQLLLSNDLMRIEGDAARQAVMNDPAGNPTWFLPKPSDAYDVWRYRNDSNSEFRVIIDRATGDLFLSDRQL
jgi:hypothetical protein